MKDNHKDIQMTYDSSLIMCLVNTLLYTELNMVTTKLAPADKLYFSGIVSGLKWVLLMQTPL